MKLETILLPNYDFNTDHDMTMTEWNDLKVHIISWFRVHVIRQDEDLSNLDLSFPEKTNEWTNELEIAWLPQF